MIARRVKLSVLALLAATAVACSADISTGPRVQPPPPPSNVLLKDIVIPNLPSPYYHFDYDGAGRIVAASFASDVTKYDVLYDGNRISEMRNTIPGNRNRLVYTYDNAGRVASVRYVDGNGFTFAQVLLSYDGQRLMELERDVRATGGFVIDKRMRFSYYGDGNLLQIDETRPPIPGVQPQSRTIDRFVDYDDGINVDSFSVIHNDFSDQLVLLPQVQLQKANPLRETLETQVENDPFITVDVVYSYTYDGMNRPLTKIGAVTILNGPNAGERARISSFFSYY